MKKRFYLVLVLVCALLASCSSNRDFVYLHDMSPMAAYPYNVGYEAVVHNGDRLKIVVSSKTPELAIPFNVKGSNFRVDAQGNVAQSNPGENQSGYLVDKEGDIEFPVLGKLHVDGLKLSEVSELIRNKIAEKKYIKEPLVDIQFLNFKYVVLGAVGGNGSYSVTGDRITLLEAIANAGDLTPNARLDRVCVIREEGGERKIYYNDIRSTDLFKSPTFYLQQNDVIYVEPKNKPSSVTEEKFFRYFTVFLSLVTATTSILWITTK